MPNWMQYHASCHAYPSDVVLAALLASGLAFAQDATSCAHRPDARGSGAGRSGHGADDGFFQARELREHAGGGGDDARRSSMRDAFSHFLGQSELRAGRDASSSAMRCSASSGCRSPSSTQASDGLGPLFNARACQSCHLKDGRGHPPFDGDARKRRCRCSCGCRCRRGTDDQRLALDGVVAGEVGDPTYGTQLQDFAVPGLKAEGRMVIDYADLPVTLGDGTVVTLREPHYSVADLAYGPLARRCDAVAARGAADDRAGAGGADSGGGYPGACRSRRCRWRRDFGQAELDASIREAGKVMIGRFGWKAGMRDGPRASRRRRSPAISAFRRRW